MVLDAVSASYLDLDIPASAESRFTGDCATFGERYAGAAGKPIDMKLHYVLPHYHYLGNYFDLSFDRRAARRAERLRARRLQR